VTCKQGVKNDHTFGIPVAILTIHYTTFMGLRWRLRGVQSINQSICLSWNTVHVTSLTGTIRLKALTVVQS